MNPLFSLETILQYLALVIISFSALVVNAQFTPEALMKQCAETQTIQQCRKAIPACEQLEAARHNKPPSRERDLALAEVWNKRLECEGELGHYSAAEKYGRDALAIRQQLLGPVHLDIAESLSNLAWTLDLQGRYIEEEFLHRQALAMREKLLGSEHPDVAQSLSVLGLVLEHLDKFAEAESCLVRAMVMENKFLSKEDPQRAYNLEGLALLLSRQGKVHEAEAFVRQSLELRKKAFGLSHPLVHLSTNNLASVLNRKGQYKEAEIIYRQLLNIRRMDNYGEHLEGATTMNNLAFVLNNQQKYEEAEELFRRALAIRKKYQGQEHPSVIELNHNLAVFLNRHGKLREAETLFRFSLAKWEKMFGPEHHRIAISLVNLGHCLLRQGHYADALEALIRSSRIRENVLRATFSETRMQAWIELLRNEEEMIYSLILSADVQPGMRRLALTQALLRKGRTMEAGKIANRLMHQNRKDSAIQTRLEQWMSVRQKREALLFGGIAKIDTNGYQALLKHLDLEVSALEAQLAQALPRVHSFDPPAFDDIISEMAQHIPSDSVMIEVLVIRPDRLQATQYVHRWGLPHLLALILFPDQEIVSVDLGAATEIDGAVSTLAQSLSRPSSDPKPAAKALYEQLFAKLVPHLKGRKDVYLSLDGSLHLIPFDALHDGTDYLLGRYKFHYLTSGRDLLRKPSSQPVGPALVIGNPYFGSSANSSPETASSVYQRLTTLSDLPWAQQEAETVAQLLGVRAVTGASAKEELLRERLAPSVVHLATHGLFLTDVAAPMSPGTRSALLMARPAVEKKPASTETPVSLPGVFGPMNRAALVFANARQGATVEDNSKDGLLTAEEARSLDLDGTQLVVLSACETGQGETSSGQGVYGLRRAFLIAGAETVVTSLWRVHDEATGELMTKYYGKLLDKEHPGDRLGAMIESMQELRARPGREHPYYWAPFLVIGADGPLRHTAMR